MAEAFNDKMLSGSKAERYAEVAVEIASVLAGEPNLTARMATVASMLANSFDHYFWTGFYVVDPARAEELVVGPYQGMEALPATLDEVEPQVREIYAGGWRPAPAEGPTRDDLAAVVAAS